MVSAPFKPRVPLSSWDKARHRALSDDWNAAHGIVRQLTKSILIVVGGQSIRRGSAKRLIAGATDPTAISSYETVLTRAMANRRTDPLSPARSKGGSWWPHIIDGLAAKGIDADILNACIGGSSIKQWSGAFRAWSASTRYCQQRTAENGDGGDKGEFIIAGGKILRCTTGAKRYGYGAPNIDYILYSGLQVSGTTAPNWSTLTAVGQTITDGGLVWTVVDTVNSNNYATTTAVSPTDATYGDPLGLHARMAAAADAAILAKNYDEIWYCWGSASAETPPTNGAIFYAANDIEWRDRLTAFANWAFTTKGANYVGLGLDPWSPALSGVNGASIPVNRQLYDVLDRGLERAINSFQGGANDGKVVRLANLYRTMGFTPPVYPEAAAPLGIHLTDIGNEAAGEEDLRLFLAKSAGAVVKPYVETQPVNATGVLSGLPVNAPFIHINNSPVASATVGTTLSLFTGNWAGGWVTAGAVQWYRDGIAIAGATAATYTLVSADSGHIITASSAKVNAIGTGTATTPLGVTVS
jgi:hypothetical protein